MQKHHPVLHELGEYYSFDAVFGMGLFKDEILPTVPKGPRPIILTKPSAWSFYTNLDECVHREAEDDPHHLFTTTYKVVQNLVGNGIVGNSWSDSPTRGVGSWIRPWLVLS